jgi:beta-N-acetylglucosaminidase
MMKRFIMSFFVINMILILLGVCGYGKSTNSVSSFEKDYIHKKLFPATCYFNSVPFKKKKVPEVSQRKQPTSRGIFFGVRNLKSALHYDMSVLSHSGLPKEYLHSILSGTKLEGLEEAYLEAEYTYGVNALFLISLSALESGWGKSRMATRKNNLFGFQAYDSATHKAKRFVSKRECILYVAKYLKENYLNEEGKYHSGNTISSINKRYASDGSWANKVYGVMKYSLGKIERSKSYQDLGQERVLASV